MFKKLTSFIAIVAMAALLFPMSVFAALRDGMISTLTVAESFDPAASETLTVSTTFNITTYAAQLAHSNGYIVVKSGSTVVATLQQWTNASNVSLVATIWDGKTVDTSGQALCGTAGAACPNGQYGIEVFVADASGGTTDFDIVTSTFYIGEPPVQEISISSFTATPTSGTTFDPSPSGDNENLTISYTLSGEADSVAVVVKDPNGDTVKNFSSTNSTTNTHVWDGRVSGKLAVPGDYTITITVTEASTQVATQNLTTSIVYGSAEKGDITDFTVIPADFDPDTEDTVISFKNTKTSNIRVEILNSTRSNVRTFSSYSDNQYSANETHEITWNGLDNSNNQVSVGNYTVSVVSRNDYGVVAKTLTVMVNNEGGTISTSNSHISGITFSPSGEFEPAKDEELEIQFDTEKDLDELTVYAVRGTEKIELFNEEDLEEENNLEILWDGTNDDDEYVAKGTWRIQFESKIGSITLTAAKSIDVEYEKPLIDDVYISKKDFDNDLGEFIYVMFRVDAEAEVDIMILQDGDDDEFLTEDMEVEKDKWYAVEFDGEDYDYEDDIDLKVIANNPANDDVFDSETIGVNLDEDDVSSNKSNVTNDYISPVLTGGNDEMTLYYEIDEDADVTITIHKGETASGSSVIELLDIEDQAAGDHSVVWNGKDKDGDKLAKGVYSYKIVSRVGSTDTEKGVFIVGTVGDIEGEASGGDSSSAGDDDDDQDSNVAPGVIVDGGSSDGDDDDDDNGGLPSGTCAGFLDVPYNSQYCDAVTYVKNSGIFAGYPTGNFDLYSPINRAEIMKVIMEAFDVSIPASILGNLGFSDVIPGAWYMRYLSAGKTLGIVSGDSNATTVRPDSAINRAEALKLVFETMRATTGYQVDSCDYAYADTPGSAWYLKYACGSKSLNNLFDTMGVYFSPESFVTRAEMAQLFYRLNQHGLL